MLHRPLPPAAKLRADARVLEAYDKGAGKGAVIYTETTVREEGDSQPLATLISSVFCRGDGGFGYDPIVVPDEGDGRTFAEMTPAEKHAISHRARAFTALRDLL